jgi:hypothetical protein
MKVVIEEYKHKPRMYKGKDMTKEMFFLPAIPWKWTLYRGLKVITYGYCHTEEQAEIAASGALKYYR